MPLFLSLCLLLSVSHSLCEPPLPRSRLLQRYQLGIILTRTSSLTNTPPSHRGRIYPSLFPQRCPSFKWENLASPSLSRHTHAHTRTSHKIQHSSHSDRFTVRVELLHVSDLCLLVSWDDSCLWVPLLTRWAFFPNLSVCLFLAVKCLFMNVHTDIHSELPFLHL